MLQRRHQRGCAHMGQVFAGHGGHFFRCSAGALFARLPARHPSAINVRHIPEHQTSLSKSFWRRRERLGLKPPGMNDGGEHDERAFEAWLRDAAIVKPPVPCAPPPPPPPKPAGPVRFSV